jgi:tetratricopeptide (TPR) repeat protein
LPPKKQPVEDPLAFDDAARQSDALILKAAQARRENRLSDAKRDLLQAVGICRRAALRQPLASALTALGQIERDMHHLDYAIQHYQEAAALYRAEGNPLKLAHTVRHAADIYRNQNRRDLAEPSYHEALAIYRSHPETPPLDLANAIRGLAILLSNGGSIEEAKSLWQAARDLYSAVGVEAGVAECNRRIVALSQA